jgi:hypothetical protein
MTAKSTLSILVATAALAIPAGAQVFNGEDRDGDGVISRREWRGNNRSFASFDRDGDGYIRADETPAGMRRGNRRNERGYGTSQRNRAAEPVDKLDRNNSGVVEGYEWPYNSAVFHRLDRDGNSVLSRDELRNIDSSAMTELDTNNNQRIDTNEWPGGFADFDRLDQNRDGTVSNREYFERGGEFQRRNRFTEWDTNRDGMISSTEWKSRPDLFHKLDRSGDSQVSWDEFMASTEQYDRPFGWRNR